MKPPCELIVSKILPSIRAAIVKQLIEDHNMKQTKISTILGISQSAVSQYYTSARAADESALALFPEIVKYAKDVADKIARGKISKDQILLCEPCRRIREDDKFCDFHKEFDQFMICKICQESSD